MTTTYRPGPCDECGKPTGRRYITDLGEYLCFNCVEARQEFALGVFKPWQS